MAGQYFRILDAQTLSASKAQDRTQVLDLGAYTQLNIHARVIQIGTGTDANATVALEHASVNEETAFTPKARRHGGWTAQPPVALCRSRPFCAMFVG